VPVGIGEPQLRRPAVGRSLPQVSRVPAGHFDKSTRSVPRNQAPVAMPPLARIADPPTAVLRVSTASRMAASIAQPSENPPLAVADARANPWVAPAESERSDLWSVAGYLARAVIAVQRIECLPARRVIGGGFTAGVARPQQPGQGLPAGDCRGDPKHTASESPKGLCFRVAPRSPCCRNDRR